MDDPVGHVVETQGLLSSTPRGNAKSKDEVAALNKKLSAQRSEKLTRATPKGESRWSNYPQEELASPQSGRSS